MPQSTPVYSFTYPCPGEVISPAAIALLATQIDTKLADVNNDLFAALNRYNVDLPGVQQTIAAGVDTVITVPQYTFPVSGVYVVRFQAFQIINPATFNAVRIRPRINAVARFGETANTETNQPMNPSGSVPMVAVAGDVASATVLYNGVGTMDVIVNMSIKMLCRIA